MQDKVELWKKVSGVKIYKHTVYYEDFIPLDDMSLLGRLFHLKNFYSIGFKEFVHYSFRYKLKDGRTVINEMSGLMLECAKNPMGLIKLECRKLKKATQ